MVERPSSHSVVGKVESQSLSMRLVTLYALTSGVLLFGICLSSPSSQAMQSLPPEPNLPALGSPRGQRGEGDKGASGPTEDRAERPDDTQSGLARDWPMSVPDSVKQKFARLEDRIRGNIAEGVNAKPDAEEKGSGAGKNPQPEVGKVKLSKREKRNLRWHMRFTATSGPEYLAQLHGLGAILAIPVKEEEGAEPTYQVIRDLRPGKAKLKDEDLTKIQRIFWIDDKEDSVKDVMAALGLRLPKTPKRFLAFMPEKLEDELFQMERRYVEKVLRQPFDEDKIETTVFRPVPHKVDGKTTFKVELISVKMKP